MNFYQFLSKIIELLLSFSFNSVNLIFQRFDFLEQVITITIMVSGLTFNLLQKFANFFIFDGDDLFQSI